MRYVHATLDFRTQQQIESGHIHLHIHLRDLTVFEQLFTNLRFALGVQVSRLQWSQTTKALVHRTDAGVR